MNRHPNDNDEKKGEGLGIRLLQFVVHLMVPSRVREEFEGDLLEEWSSSVVPRLGKLKGMLWLCSQLLRSVVPMGCIWIRGFFLRDNEMFQKQNVPKSVRMVAAAFLLFVAINLAGSVYMIATAHEFAPLSATIGLLKAVLFIAITVGLLNLSEACRKLVVFFSGYCVLVIPVISSTFALSPHVVREFTEVSVVHSLVVVELSLVIVFAIFLWVFITLRRADVKRAFEPGGQETLAA